MFNSRTIRAGVTALAITATVGCGLSDNTTPIGPDENPTIVDVAVANGSFTTLITALQAANLVSTLQGDGPFTVFAPTDDAFAALPAGVLDALLDDEDLLTEVLLYHVVPGSVLASDVVGLSSATTVNGANVSVTVNGSDVVLTGLAPLNDVNVVQTDVLGANGVIHVIDGVLLPEVLYDIAQQAEGAGFNTLIAALEAAELTDVLKGTGPFTVFAPTEDAFAALGFTLEALLADPMLLGDILKYHVVDGAVDAATVVGLTSATTLEGSDVDIMVNGTDVMIDGANVIQTDIEVTNGFIHVIDAVLLPAPLPTVVDIATSSPDFSTLVTALGAADLVTTLEGAGPFTVFAPTNEAFDALPDGVVATLLGDVDLLTRVLTYHVTGDLVTSSEVVGLTAAPTLNGKDIAVSLDGDDVFLDDAQITDTDIVASNGIVHVIDEVLLPETVFDIIQLAQDAGSFETLLAAVEAAGLTGTLKSGSYTVFAPTDDAFAALPEGVVADLLADVDLLTRVLTYHVASGELASGDVVGASTIATLNTAKDITVTVDGSNVMLDDSNITAVDLDATNGIVHVIDAVLLPEIVFDIIQTAEAAGTFETLLAAVEAAGLTGTLKSDGPFTVLAPTDDAFAALPAGTVEALLNDIPTLTDILLYHVLDGAVPSTTVVTLDSATTLEGSDITITVDGGNVMINDANVVIVDIETTNGIIHVLDAVLSIPTP